MEGGTNGTRGAIRVQANMRPIGHAEWQRACLREECDEACERNRFGAGRHGASEQPQQVEEEPSFEEELGGEWCEEGDQGSREEALAFDQPFDDEYAQLLNERGHEEHNDAIGTQAGQDIPRAGRTRAKKRKDPRGFQGQSDWDLSTLMYRRWATKIKRGE